MARSRTFKRATRLRSSPSRARRWTKLLAYKKRMGWKFEWVSSGANDFNYDFAVSFEKADIEAGRAMYNYAPLTFEASDSIRS